MLGRLIERALEPRLHAARSTRVLQGALEGRHRGVTCDLFDRFCTSPWRDRSLQQKAKRSFAKRLTPRPLVNASAIATAVHFLLF